MYCVYYLLRYNYGRPVWMAQTFPAAFHIVFAMYILVNTCIVKNTIFLRLSVCRLVCLFAPYRSQFKINIHQTLRTAGHRYHEELTQF